tara:strand:+ start:11865 stop:12110 length:246 start_codon:yes stop_codon:yes gene_type:complete
MLKTLANIDELQESHKKNGYTMQNNQNKVIKKKQDNKESKKLINPKFIFETKPKNYKNTNSSAFRAPETKNNMPTITENGY